MALSWMICEIKRDIGRKRDFFHTPLHLMPPLWGLCWNIAIPFGVKKKLEWWGYTMVKKVFNICNHLDRIPVCDRLAGRHLSMMH